MKKKLVILTGAGMSAESGIRTFRDANGLWEGHDVQAVATMEGFQRNPDLVHDFYNRRRRQLLQVEPNAAHKYLVKLEDDFDVQIITQNIDDLHERAGSTRVLHLHGELLKIRSLTDPELIKDWREDLTTQYLDENNHAYRPHVVWFGEAVPLLSEAVRLCALADVCLIIGTSLQVYPAAALLEYCPPETPIFYLDPNPGDTRHFSNSHQIIELPYKATEGIQYFHEKISDFK